MVIALPLFGAFVLGLGARHFAVLFRAQFAVGMGLLAALAGWSFELTVRNVAALGVLLGGQVATVVVAERLFCDRTDGRWWPSGCSATRRSGRCRSRP